MNLRRIPAAILIALSTQLLATLVVAQTTLTFRQGLNGYNGVTDTMLQQSSPSSGTAGTGPTIDVVGGTSQKQGLVKFANIIGNGASQIPAGAQITSATLALSVWQAGSGVAVHRMNAPWTEASTWNSLVNGLQIGDEEAHWSAVDTKTNLPVGLATFDVTSVVQEWANGAEVNEGFALLPTGGTTTVRIDSRESTYTSGKSWEIQPTLTVTFTAGGGGGGGGGQPTISAVSPADGSTNAGGAGSVPLQVNVSDPDNQALTVTFYGREKGAGGAAGPDFTLVQIPDTQFYSENSGTGRISDFRNMTTWMVSNKTALNIQFVAHMGDMVQNRDDVEQEWINADSAMGIIENPATTGLTHGIPWGGAPGNHDQNRSGGRNQFWNEYFGTTRWAGRTYFRGGYSDGTTDANYQFFSASGMDFIVINMEYRASATMIAWADALLKANPTRRAIITSHEIVQAYLDAGTPVDQAPFFGQGRAIYDGLKNNPNLFLMLCGHWHGEGRRSDTYQGRTVHSILCDYQTEVNGGDSWLRYLTFSPSKNTITSNVIRTRDGARRTGNESQFTLNYNMSGGSAAPWTNIGTVSVAAGGTSATLNWTGLQAGKEYEWYAAASDGGTPVSTTVRAFTPGNNVPPTVSLTGPTNGATVARPATVNFTATASDSDGTVARVEFYQGTVKVGEDSTSPYSYNWDAPAGTYTLTAVAVDNNGARTTSAARTVTVTGSGGGGGTPAAPTIALVYPAADATTAGGSGRMPLEASVADANGDPLTVTFYGRQKAAPVGNPFTVVAIPDTQYYSETSSLYPNFTNQMNWINSQRSALNIQFVSHMGDMIQNGDGANAEWQRASDAMAIIENNTGTGYPNGMPWGGGTGNHDGGGSSWNQYFGPSRWSGRTYFRGGITGSNATSNYQFFSASGLDFIVIHLRYNAGSTEINWANSLLQANPSRRAIVTSHEIMGTGVQGSFSGSGSAIYNGLRGNANLFLLLCGHIHGDGRRSDTFNGRTVQTILTDYQSEANGGDSWLRYLTFNPAQNTVESYVIRTRDGATRTGSTQRFSFAYDMGGGGGGGTPGAWVNLGTVSVPSGQSVARLDWTGLTAGTAYEWYAAVSDGGTPVSSAARSFTMSSNTAPTVALTGPANGSTVNLPGTVNFTATASDSGSVARVEFYANGLKVGEDTTSPYSYSWSAPAGTHTVYAVAVDGVGARTTSGSVTVNVITGNSAPTVALTSPGNGASIALPAPVNFAATAADSDGTIAKVEFYHGSTKVGEDTTAPYTFSWNAGPGSYSLTAVAEDNLGARTTSSAVSITVNNTPPTVALTAPASGSSFRAGDVVSLAADASDSDGSIARVEFFNGATKIGEDSTAPYTLSFTPAAGTVILTAVAHDNFGATTTSAPVSITVTSNAPPTVALTAPANGASVALPNSVNLAATATDSDGSIVRVEFFNGATKIGEDASAPYTFSWAAAPGTYTVTAVAQDNNNARTTSAPVTVTVTNQAPSVTLTAPANGATISLPQPVSFAAEATDPDSAIARVEFYSGATKVGEDTIAPYTFTWAAAPGTYTVTARAVDVHNASTTSTAATITVVNPPPTVELTAPTGNATLNLPGPFTLAADAADEGAIAKVEFYAGATKLGEDATAPYTQTWTPISGSYTLTAVAQDNLGARTTSAPVTVTVANPNNVPPAVALTSPAGGQTLPANSPVSLAATASDSDGVVAKVEFYSGETKLGEDATAPFTFTWPGAAAGSYVLTAVATDNDGGVTSSGPVTVTLVNNVPPVVTVTAPLNGQHISGSTITITATATDSDGTITKVEFFRNGTKIGEDTTAPYSFAWTGATAGSHVLHAVATDDDGATGAARPIRVTVSVPTTLTFQQGVNGYTSARDTNLRGAASTTNYGSATTLSTDADDLGSPSHTLLAFDGIIGTGANQIPPGATITSATLALQVMNPGSGFTVHRMLAAWSESSTWSSMASGVSANNVEAVAASLTSVGANNSNPNVSVGTLNLTVTSAVQEWVNGAANQGVVLLPYSSGTDGVDIYSREWSTASQRPRLSVTFTAPASESAPIIVNEGYNGNHVSIPPDRWLPGKAVEFLLTRDHTAAELMSYAFGDSTQYTLQKTTAWRFTNLAAIAPIFRAGTLIVVRDATATQELHYAPAPGASDDQWNVHLSVGGGYVEFIEGEGTNNFGYAPMNDVVWIDATHTGLTDLVVTHGLAWDDPAINGIGTFTTSGGNLALASIQVNVDEYFAFTGGSGDFFNGTKFINSGTTGSLGLPNPQGTNAAYVASLRGTMPAGLPVVTLRATDAVAGEYGRDRTLVFTLTRTGSTASALRVPLVATGTATPGADYTGFGTLVEIPAGTASGDLVLTVLPDDLSEGRETVTLTLGESVDFVAGSPRTATATISDRPVHDWLHSKLPHSSPRRLEDDDDFGGDDNLVEYFFGTSPTDAASRSSLTVVSVHGGETTLRLTRAKNLLDVLGRIEWSRDMRTWFRNGASDGLVTVTMTEQVVTPQGDDPETVEVKATVSGQGVAPGSVPQLSFRLVVELAP